MKQAFLLIVLSVLVGWSAQAQTTTTVEKQTKRITITTTKVDESGKPVTETWIAEGEQPETILRDMAIHPDIIQKVDVASPGEAVEGERLFLFRSAGDSKVIEGKLSEGVDPIAIEADVIILHNDENGDPKECKKVVIRSASAPHYDKMYLHEGRKSNCAALGVYVNSYGEKGCRINSLIEQGGAGEAGLKEGDVIRSIDEFEILDYATLHLAMSHFSPGDVVTVKYDREGKEVKAKVELKDWAKLPGHEYRSRPDCMPDEPKAETPVEDPMLDDPVEVTGMEALRLEDALVYPNPTEGLFAFSFTTAPGPITVSVTDVNGKVIYTEENENAAGRYNREINLKEFPAGSYILSVKQNDKIFTQQISKQ